jgi:hypothetical protein
MDYTLVIGLLVVLVVGFFAFQWMNKRSVAKFTGSKSPAPAAEPITAGSTSIQPPKEEAYPAIPGQTQAEALTKEPIQRREPSSQQGPVTAAGDAPAQFDEHLRHPEQLFHQPSGASLTPSLEISDLGSGRAAAQSTPLGPAPTGAGQQGFSPEMAQNGGAFIGNSVFAFDGMEPVGFTSF